MKIDFSNLIKKLPTTTKSTRAMEVGFDKSKPKPEQYPGLGDVARFKNFPPDVNRDFIDMYRQDLDNFLIPYVKYGEMTVSKASKFIENLVSQIFGNSHHYGLFSYLKARNYDNDPERELVRTAERLINSGWRIRKDDNSNRYKIFNNEGTSIIDATGPSEFFNESVSITLDSSSAHLFIDSANASKIESIARKVNMNADALAEIDSLDNLLLHTDDNLIRGQIVNYKKLKGILSARSSYHTGSTGISVENLYKQGYTLSNRMLFSHDDRVIMQKGNEQFILYPITSDLNMIYGPNKDLLAYVSSVIKSQIFKSVPMVANQKLFEVKQMTRVIALISDYWSEDRTRMSIPDMIDSLRRLDAYVKSGEVTRDFYNRVFSAFSSIVVTESILLGNKWMSLGLMGLDPISGRMYTYASRDVFTVTDDELNAFSYAPSTNPPSFSAYTNEVFPFRLDKDLSPLLNNLPDEYFSALSSVDFEGDYAVSLSGITDYVARARDKILSAVGK
jgi:hypothetical protein